MALVKFGVAGTLAFLMLGMGVSTIAEGQVHSWQVLVVTRVLVGIFEASIFPACVYLISSWNVRYKAHQKLAMMYSIGLVASAFAGVLAYALALLQGRNGWNGWRWIFTVSRSEARMNHIDNVVDRRNSNGRFRHTHIFPCRRLPRSGQIPEAEREGSRHAGPQC